MTITHLLRYAPASPQTAQNPYTQLQDPQHRLVLHLDYRIVTLIRHHFPRNDLRVDKRQRGQNVEYTSIQQLLGPTAGRSGRQEKGHLGFMHP